MLIWIASLNNLEETVPVGLAFFFYEIVFVSQRPPNIAARCEPGDNVAQVSVVHIRRHPVKSPVAFVVGMKQNDVRLNPKSAQLADQLLEMLEKLRIESRKIPMVWWGTLERIIMWLILVPVISLGANTHAELIEWW